MKKKIAKQKKKRRKNKNGPRKAVVLSLKIFIVVFIILLPLSSIIFTSLIILKTYNISKVITEYNPLEKHIDNNENESFNVKEKAKAILSQTQQLVGVKPPQLKKGSENRINILLLGKASADYPGSQLTDTIILASYDPLTNGTAMLSLPRDLYTKIPESQSYTKLNAIYHYGYLKNGNSGGLQYIKQAIKEITGQKVDYFIMVDFKGFVQVVDQIGGIKVNVTKELTDYRYPGPNYSYQTFQINKGIQDLNGETALKYVRTRHNPGGDFGRAFRQQQVLAAVKNKFFSIRGISFLTKLNSVLEIISEHTRTNIEFSEYGSFLAIAKNINTHNIVNKVIDNRGNNPILANYSPNVRGGRAYMLFPAAGDYSQIKEIAENIFDLNKLRATWGERKIENPRVLIINNTGNYSLFSKAKKRINDLGIKNVTIRTERKEISPNTTIYDNTQGLKLYSFDSLLRSFDADNAMNNHPGTESFDFVIVLGENLNELFKEKEIILPKEAFGQEDY